MRAMVVRAAAAAVLASAAMAVDFTSPSVGTQVVRAYLGNADPAVAGTPHLDNIKIRAAGDTW